MTANRIEYLTQQIHALAEENQRLNPNDLGYETQLKANISKLDIIEAELTSMLIKADKEARRAHLRVIK